MKKAVLVSLFWLPRSFAESGALPASTCTDTFRLRTCQLPRVNGPSWGRKNKKHDESLFSTIDTSINNVLQLPRGGGIGNSNNNNNNGELSFTIDSFTSLANAAATLFVNEVAPVISRESQNAAKYAKAFLEQQQQNAAERRKQYREQAGDLGATTSTLTNPMRALKLTLAAFVITEALQYVDGEAVELGDLTDLAAVAADNVVFQAENFWKVGRDKGGLLRFETWRDRNKFLNAFQKQVFPKYQWAIGAALGFVISPVIWSIGWAAFGGAAVVYVVAECHNYAKRQYDPYFHVLKATKNPLIFFIDDILEDFREFVEKARIDPKATLFTLRENVDSRIDFDFPPHLQRGLLFGGFVGVLAGV